MLKIRMKNADVDPYLHANIDTLGTLMEIVLSANDYLEPAEVIFDLDPDKVELRRSEPRGGWHVSVTDEALKGMGSK